MLVRPLSRTDREKLQRAVRGLNQENDSKYLMKVFVKQAGITVAALLIIYAVARIFWGW